MKKTREERVADLLERDRELMAQLKSARPDELPALQKERTKIKSQMNLYGQEATKRLREQDFAEFTDLVAEQEEARKARWAKHPELLEKMRQVAREAAE